MTVLAVLSAGAEAKGAENVAPAADQSSECWVFKPRTLAPQVIDQGPLSGMPLPPSLGAGGGAVFLASTRDHRIICLDATTGKPRWDFTTGAAVREAPSYWDGKVYFGSDDGFVYCLDAATGKPVWKSPPPAERRNIAYGEIVSAWPARTNVLVLEGVAYFASGAFPHDGAFVTALDAKTGKLVWQNAASGEYPHDWGALSPIGRLSIKEAAKEKENDTSGLLVANEGMGGKLFNLSNGNEFLRAAQKYKQSVHIIAAQDDGRKFSMSKAGVVCNGPAGAPRQGETAEPVVDNPFGDTKPFAVAAEAIVKQSGVKDGYALVLDCRSGALALELARRTNLFVCAIFRDEAELDTARRALQQTGLYGVRITAHFQAPGTPLQYPRYFADLIVSEKATSGEDLPPVVADVARHLKPIRGIALIGSADGKHQADGLLKWAQSTGVEKWQAVEQDGRWAKCVRAPLAEPGGWTHQNGDAGNTLCSGDGELKPPLGVWWYGAPFSREMVNRTGVAPLIVSGVLISPGAGIIEGYDQYTGRRLWRREMKNVSRLNPYGGCGNLAANSKYLFVAYGHNCHQIDLLTGQTLKTHGAQWGWVACDEERLYGSTGNEVVGGAIFARNIESGETLWSMQTGNLKFQNNTVAMGDGSIYFIMDGFSPESQKQAVDEILAYARKNLPEEDRKQIEAQEKARDTRILVAIDIKTGKIRYERGIDVTDCGGAANNYEGMQRRKYPPALIYKDGVLLHFNASAGGKYWGNWCNNNWAWRAVAARNAEDGSLKWFKVTNFRGRLVVVDNIVHADPWTLDLKTGEFQTRTHPITGEDTRWVWCRFNKHCGIYVSSKYFLFGRSGGIGYHDLLRDRGLYTFLHSRPSCWFDTVSGGGMMIKPPQSFGCACEVTAPFTVAMGQVEHEPATPQVYAAWGPHKPVKHLYIDFGGVGDHHDPAGNLWLAATSHRGPPGLPMLRFQIQEEYYEGGREAVRSSVFTPIANTDIPFVFATMARGLRSATIPLAEAEKAEPGVYKVALGFAALPGDEPGKRIFSIKIQDKVVLENFDVVKEAGGVDRAIWKEFDGIEATDKLVIELVAGSDTPKREELPILNALKIIRK